MRKPSRSVKDAAREGMRRQLRFLGQVIRMKEVTQVELTEALGWAKSKVSLLLNEKIALTQGDLLRILEALGVAPADFYRGVYVGDWPTPEEMVHPIAVLRRAERRIRESSALSCGTPAFERFHVECGWPVAMTAALEEARPRRDEPVRWFVSGQPRVGLTTEMSVFVDRIARQGSLMPCPVAVDPDELRDGAGAEVVLARALETTMELADRIEVELTDRARMLEALATPRVPGRLLARLLEGVADASREQTDRELLLVVEGLEHLPRRAGLRFFRDEVKTLFQPAVSQVVVMPLFLLVTRPEARFVGQTFLLPPVTVVEEILGFEGIHPGGLAFFEELIGRYLPLSLIRPEARRGLVRLSAGIVGDMLALTGEACKVAHRQIADEHVEEVATRQKLFWRSRLDASDLLTLRQVVDDPSWRDSPRLRRLVALNAVLVGAGETGWAARVHPAVRPLLKEV